MTRPSGPRGGWRASGHPCAELTKEGSPCPVHARRQPDQDGLFRCHHHSIAPAVKEAMALARARGGLEATGSRPAVVSFERFATAEALDQLFDEALSVLRSELRSRKADKPRVTGAIAQLADSKLQLKSLEFTARALGRLKPGQLPEAAS